MISRARTLPRLNINGQDVTSEEALTVGWLRILFQAQYLASSSAPHLHQGLSSSFFFQPCPWRKLLFIPDTREHRPPVVYLPHVSTHLEALLSIFCTRTDLHRGSSLKTIQSSPSSFSFFVLPQGLQHTIPNSLVGLPSTRSSSPHHRWPATRPPPLPSVGPEPLAGSGSLRYNILHSAPRNWIGLFTSMGHRRNDVDAAAPRLGPTPPCLP